MRKTYIALAFVVVVLVAGLGYLALVPGAANLFRSTQTIADPKVMEKSVVVFVRNPYKDDYNVLRIPGYVDNRGNQEIAELDLEIQLYEGEKRRELVEYTLRDIKPGTRKSFDANAGTIDIGRQAQVKIVGLEVYR